MKAETSDNTKVPQYPKLRKGIMTGAIGLFTNATTGTIVVAKGISYNIGTYKEDWEPKDFEDLPSNIIVELSND